MPIDENEFFRQVTVLVCSSLDLETALQRTLNYLAHFMPVDSIFLHLYENSLGAIRTVTEVTATETKTMDKITSLTREGRNSFEKPGVPNVRIVNVPDPRRPEQF